MSSQGDYPIFNVEHPNFNVEHAQKRTSSVSVPCSISNIWVMGRIQEYIGVTFHNCLNILLYPSLFQSLTHAKWDGYRSIHKGEKSQLSEFTHASVPFSGVVQNRGPKPKLAGLGPSDPTLIVNLQGPSI